MYSSQTEFDEQFKSFKYLKWLPFVGKDYREKKILFAGDSHYEDGDHWQMGNYNVSRMVINQCVLDESNKQFGKSRILNSIERTILNKENVSREERRNFWTMVSYTNLVQDLLANNRAKPSEKQIDEGWNNFLDLCTLLKPEVVIKFGVRGFGRLGYVLDKQRKDWKFDIGEFYKKPRIISLSHLDNSFKIVFTNHPTGSFGYNYKKWSSLINQTFPGLKERVKITS